MLNVAVTEEGLLLRDKAVEVPAKISESLDLKPDEAAQLQKILQQVMKNFE